MIGIALILIDSGDEYKKVIKFIIIDLILCDAKNLGCLDIKKKMVR
jgi:hypothetical protein